MAETITERLNDPDEDDQFGIFRKPDGSYMAGLPGYKADFNRDVVLAGILAGRPDILHAQLGSAARHQGIRDDPQTGELPGKMHHEFPGARLDGRTGLTTYNSCDSTSLSLIGAEGLSQMDGNLYRSIILRHDEQLELATEHILSSVGAEDNLFKDLPPAGSSGYSLRVTYWKDSILPRSDGKLEPVYPVAYGQAHFIAARSLLSAGRILRRPELEQKADDMFRAGITEFIRPDGYVVYQDSEGELLQESSDELHSLAYIPAAYKDTLPLDDIRRRAQTLETQYGFMCTPPGVADKLSDTYHGDKIWVFEQAMIHHGATKFGLHAEAEQSSAIAPYIGAGQELFGLYDGKLQAEGNDRQLWSVAADQYFAGAGKFVLSRMPWL